MPRTLKHALHADLARLLADAELDPVLRVREVARHLRAIGDDDACASYLLAQEPTLLREGATAELLRGFDALPVERRAPIVTVTLARTRARMLDLERAHRELERLVARPEQAIPEAWLVLGQVAMLRGDLEAAATALRQVDGLTEIPSFLRQLIMISAAIVDTHRGEGEAGRRRLVEVERLAADPDEAGLLVLMRCFLAWLDERDEELEAMLRPNEWFSGCVAALRANVVAPGLAAALCARLGRFDEAETHFAQASSALRRDEDQLSRVTLAFARATIDFERGERAAAEAQLSELCELYQTRGHVLGVLICNALRARLLVLMGRRPGAALLLDATAARTAQLGFVSVGRQVMRARDEDVVRQLAAGPQRSPSPSSRGRWARTRALQAVRLAAAGEDTTARRMISEDAPLVAGPGYGVERALGHIATAIGARLDGREPDAVRELERATTALADDGADPGLVARHPGRARNRSRDHLARAATGLRRARDRARCHRGRRCANRRDSFASGRGFATQAPVTRQAVLRAREPSRHLVVEGCAGRAALGHQLQTARPRQPSQGLGHSVALADRRPDVVGLRRRWLPPRRAEPVPVPRRADK